MPKSEKISMSVIRRLPRYYRFLYYLKRNGVTRISSRELSARMGLTASQIRQDLNCFGGFGQQGYGYIVDQLYEEIGNILGIKKNHKAILIGAGNLGRAIATHLSFESRGFHLIGVFDKDPELIGQSLRDVPIENSDLNKLRTFCETEKPVVAILCVPREAVAEILEVLIPAGVKGFWNFSHFDISLKYPDVAVESVHLNDSLMTLCYKINQLHCE